MFTAKDLLYKAIDYDGFWNTSKRMMNSKPSKLRALQLEKLLMGFGISKINAKGDFETRGNYRIEKVYAVSGRSKSMNRTEYLKTLTNFQYFARGEFIDDASREYYQDLIDRIFSVSRTFYPEQSKMIDQKSVSLKHLFYDLYNFRLSVNLMFKYNYSQKRIKECSITDDYLLYLRKKFMNSMDVNLAEIDEILCTLISPENKVVDEVDINYPIEDLKAIDEEWRNENHQ